MSDAPTESYDPGKRGTPRLAEATPRHDYVVHLRFEDGVAADVDLGYLRHLGGVFEVLREREFFARLGIEEGGATICWPGELDIAPETLYAHTLATTDTSS